MKSFYATQILLRFTLTLLVCIVVFMLYRVIGFAMFAPAGTLLNYQADLIDFVFIALRWDIKVLAIWFAPWLLLMLVAMLLPTRVMHILKRVSFSYFVVAALLCLWLGGLNLAYINAFNEPFNSHAFNFLADETSEIIKLMWQQYHLGWALLGMLLSAILTAWGVRKLDKRLPAFGRFSAWHWLYLMPMLIVLVSYFARGSFSTFPLMKENSNISDSRICNDLALNGPAQLEYAYQLSRDNVFSNNLGNQSYSKYGFANLSETTSALLPEYQHRNNAFALPLIKQSAQQSSQPNVLFILMESFSSHIVESHSETNNMLMGLENWFNQGYYFDLSVSNRQGTNRSLESILLNSPISPLSKSTVAKHAFASSNLVPFKNAGYQTQFISGGSKTWMAHHDIWPYQGFDEFYGSAAIASYADVKVANAWGVWDEYVFDFALYHLKTDASQPQFTLILTTTNHPPHMIPDDYQPAAIDITLFKDKAIQSDKILLAQLQTFQYASLQLRRFLERLKAAGKLENTIVVMTGDHTMWNFYRYSDRKDVLRSAAVPIWYLLPDHLNRAEVNTNIAVSHQDIFPTLFELALNQQDYYKLGQNMFAPDETSIAWHESKFDLLTDGIVLRGQSQKYTLDGLSVLDESSQISEAEKASILNQRALEALREQQIRSEARQYLAR